ncbi:MAG: hypothetical protein H0V63_06625 [Burkholderiaceae bacterium]|nr:hypothetical protein [Burkholderiaceae bacterium]
MSYAEFREKQWQWQDRHLAAIDKIPKVVWILLIAATVVHQAYGFWSGEHLFYSLPKPSLNPAGFWIMILVLAVVVVLLNRAIDAAIAREQSHKMHAGTE